MTDESSLIKRSQAGDGEAFAKLIEAHTDRIHLLARNVCATAPAEADDIIQETFLTAYKKIKTFRGESKLGTWLHRIAANLCFMRLRKKKGDPLPLPDDVDGRAPVFKSSVDDPHLKARKKELQTAVAHALSALPLDHRLVIVMKDIEGLPNAEIARALSLSLPAVKSRLHRARLFLRDRLAPHRH